MLSELRSTRALQKSGSSIALSQVSDGLVVRDDDWEYNRPEKFIPRSTSSLGLNSTVSKSKSYKLLPPPSQYYYQSNYKNVNRRKVLEATEEDETSDDAEDYMMTVYPEGRYLARQHKI